MKKLLLLTVCILCFLFKTEAQQWQWAKTLQSYSSNYYTNDLLLDDNDNIYLVSKVYLYNSGNQVIISKYDPAGEFLWSSTFIQQTPVWPVVKIKNNHIYVSGGLQNGVQHSSEHIDTAFINRYDLDGNLENVLMLNGSGGIRVTDFFVDDSLQVFVTGTFKDSCLFDGTNYIKTRGNEDMFVARYNPTNSLRSFKQFWNLDTVIYSWFKGYVSGENISVNSRGEIIATARYDMGLIADDSLLDDFISDDGSRVMTVKIKDGKITPLYQSAGYCCTGYSNFIEAAGGATYLMENSWSAHSSTYRLLKYDSGTDSVYALAGTSSDDTGGSDFSSFAVEENGNICTTKNTCFPYPSPVRKSCILKYDNDRHFLWADSINNNNDISLSRITSKGGYLFMLGSFKGSLAHQNITLAGNGNAATCFVAKIATDPGAAINTPVNPKTKISVFPNPSSDNFMLQFPSKITSANIYVYNYMGEPVLSKQITDTDHIEINMMNRAKGIYSVEIQTGGKTQVSKIIHE